MPIDPNREDLFSQQWYLENTGQTGGTPGVDVNPRGAWALATGEGVRIAVNDSGINPNDPDLAPNLDTGVGGNFTRAPPTDAIGPDPDLPANWHGTAVASMAAADDNGLGFLGAAPDARLASLVGIARDGALERYRNHDVVNASWGFAEQFADDFSRPELAQRAQALREAAEQGRGGLGTVTVFAAGNDFSRQGLFGIETGVGDANHHNFQNSRHTIAVGALDDNGTFAAPGNPAGFTTPGAPVLVAAPGTQVPTADLPAPNGNNPDGATTVVDGTSFAAPLVSGVAALMLDANPALGQRDVQEILALTARQNDPGQQQWRVNGAETWNGGGLHTNPNYGFGLVDAAAAVRLAASWRERDTAANEARAAASRSQSVPITAEGDIVEQRVTLDAGVEIEHVAVDLNLAHERFGEVVISLTSPAGTRSLLIDRPDGGEFGAFDRERYRVTSNEMLGESSAGTWTLRIADTAETGLVGDATTGALFDWTLTAYGEPADGDDTYVYTDEFAAAAGGGSARDRLTDAGGRDTLNAAATSGPAAIDLAPGATSTIAGAPLTLGSATAIEAAHGGAGADTIAGNADANRLAGGPGADTLIGRTGADTLLGGRGADILDGGPGVDAAVLDAPPDAVTFAPAEDADATATVDGVADTLRDVELARFADGARVPLAALVPDPGPPARVFLADGGRFALADGAEVFGRAGGAERVFVDGLAAGVRLDANVERLDLDVASADLRVGVGPDGLTLDHAGGRVPIATLPSLNQPLDLRLADGGATLEQTGAARFTLTGADGASTAIAGAPQAVDLPLTAGTAAHGPAGGESQASVFLPADGTFTLADPAEVFGRAGGGETLKLAPAAANVRLDANLERLDVPAALDALTFRVAGAGLTIADDGETLVTLPSLNQPLELRVADGDASLAQTGAATFALTGADGGTAGIGDEPVTPEVALGDAAAESVPVVGTDDPRSDDGGAIA